MQNNNKKDQPEENQEAKLIEQILSTSGNSEKMRPRKMSIKDYVTLRLISQRDWYERKASSNKSKFVNSQKAIIVLGAMIPLIVALGTVVEWVNENSAIISAFISAIIAVIAGFDKLLQPQTNWYNYRANEEILKKEEWLFLYKAGPYHNLSEEDASLLLVERVENIISSDMANFIRNAEKQDENKANDQAQAPPDTASEIKPKSSDN